MFHNSFKSTMHNSILGMEIFDLEDKTVKEEQVSEALLLLWAEFEHLQDIEAIF
jgi:Fe-S-cluster formation regulator IscX/YfhJ